MNYCPFCGKTIRELQRYKTLEKTTTEEEYQLAYSMMADYIEEKLEIIGGHK